MLQPREADIPALFLVLVVLPIFTYILLGKWSETSQKKERISLLAELAAEEALQAESMANSSSVVPFGSSFPSSLKSGSIIHICAKCLGPATTRCSRCKSVRYCSGKCQIIHWRQGHKFECELSENASSSASPKSAVERNNTIPPHISTSFDASQVPMLDKTTDKRVSRKSNWEILKEGGVKFDFLEEASKVSKVANSTASIISPEEEDYIRHKLRNNGSNVGEEEKQSMNAATSRRRMDEYHELLPSQHGNINEPRSNYGISSNIYSVKNGMPAYEFEKDLISEKASFPKQGSTSIDVTEEFNYSVENPSLNKGSGKSRSVLHPTGTKLSKSPKSMVRASREQSCSELERNGRTTDNSNDSKCNKVRDTTAVPAQAASMGFVKMMGLRNSRKNSRHQASGTSTDGDKKMKMLFPYEEFVKFFQCDFFDLSPRGLFNCGNSCYANAVLQCLTCTKPLIIYLLQRSHSRDCSIKDWCLMCELEQHVLLLREGGGPLSPSRILSHMRSINCQIGDGSQEDAHEFLRLLVTSMQSICLEGLGGENKVDAGLQETTFIQQTFGGSLKSKVKCLRCHHESERYENFMDLTLEIFGWVESLEDALTQFTTPEDLDGENMYRCGRCASYVRARKELSVHQAPNILTIVLKRFQEGKYGKINKCITFPEMLDMIPFMTGKEDIPPLYMLYAVVVHLDTLNASFSGHYVSYVKDLQGTWLRIDDTEVQPVSMGQVMSEGAYILFYTRSCPRPPRAFSGKATRNYTSASSKTQKSLSKHLDATSNGVFRSRTNRNILPVTESYATFSDATSSDWSLFTSSDEASFTTESTRDSFSTVDYADNYNANLDPFSSIINNLYAPEYSSSQRTVSCRSFSGIKTETQFILEKKGYVVESVNYGGKPKEGFVSASYCNL